MKKNYFSLKGKKVKRLAWVTWLVLVGWLVTMPIHAAERGVYKSNGVIFSISVRTPEQIRAFYIARGFPEAAIRELESKCLLTAGVLNGTNDILWLEPSKWRFTTNDGEKVTRISRDEWNTRWTQLDVPLASRATFGWTQLPESRGLLADETVGGNIAIIPPAGPFSVEAVFETGEGRHGPLVKFKASDLKCGPQAGDNK